jgi:translation initiation factor IF-2
MSETNETDTKTLRGRKPTLNLRRTVESGHVRQSFSHGRSKSVLVEKKKRRAVGAGAQDASLEEAKPTAEKPAASAPAETKAPAETQQQRRSGVVLRALSDEEKDARAKALVGARQREAEDRERAKLDAELQAVQDETRTKEREAEEGKKKEAERGEVEAAAESQPKTETAAPKPAPKAAVAEADPRTQEARHKKERAVAPRRGEDRRVRGRLTITNALDEEQRQRSLASLKRHRERQKKQVSGSQAAQQKIQREVVIPEAITIQELANRMAERGVDVIKVLMRGGDMHKITDTIDADTAQLVVEEFGHSVRRVSEADVEEGFIGGEDLFARRHPHDECRLRRGRWHHAAYRRLSGGELDRAEDHLYRHARP